MTKRKKKEERYYEPSIIEQLSATPQGEKLLHAFDEQVEKWKALFDDALAKAKRGELGQVPRGPKVPPAPARGELTLEQARAALHFGAKEALTEAKIKLRKKDLARLVHPDAGGDTDAAARVNAAADVLLKAARKT